MGFKENKLHILMIIKKKLKTVIRKISYIFKSKQASDNMGQMMKIITPNHFQKMGKTIIGT